jgi:hypothetical protein
MSFAASLLMLAAAAVPHAGKAPPKPVVSLPSVPELPVPPSRHGVVATLQATAVIVRPAIVRLSAAETRNGSLAQAGDTYFRQTRRDGRHVSVDFN